MTCGIYCFHFENSDKIYVGQSIDIEKRQVAHVHSIKHKLSNAKIIAESSKGEIVFLLLEECAQEDLNSRERFWIEFYDSVAYGLNKAAGGAKFSVQERKAKNSTIKVKDTKEPKIAPYYIINKTSKEVVLVFSRNIVAERLGINPTKLSAVHTGKAKSTKGWMLYKPLKA